MKVTAYILAKNEEVNISNCLHALKNCGLPVVVLDSGSTDRTREVALRWEAEVEAYPYRDHVEALRYICQDRTPTDEFAVVVDADTVVSPELLNEAKLLLADSAAEVAVAPVIMYWNGQPLNHGSLYPPKPFMFRGGAHYFVAVGHGEALIRGTRTGVTQYPLVHNDLKPFEAYLLAQLRYSDNLESRGIYRKHSWRDRLRKTPFMMLAVPAFSYFFRGGIFAGKIGLGYALDRFIAETIMYRQHIASSKMSAVVSSNVEGFASSGQDSR